MPTWVLLSILAPAILTVVNFTDKYILERQIKDYRGFAIFSAIVGLTAGALLWVATGFPTLPLTDGLLVVLTGVLAVFGTALYFQVLSKEETSKVIFLLQLTPVMVLALSVLFLGDKLSLRAFAGFVLIFASTLGASFEKGKGFKIKLSGPLALMLIADFFWALSLIVFKFVSETNSFVKMVSYESLGWAVGGAVLFAVFPGIRNAFFKTASALKKQALGVVFLNEIIYVASKLIGFWAISLGPVAMVSVIGSTNVFFGVAYGWILTLAAPKIFKEAIDKRSLAGKFCLASLLVLGLYFIS